MIVFCNPHQLRHRVRKWQVDTRGNMVALTKCGERIWVASRLRGKVTKRVNCPCVGG